MGKGSSAIRKLKTKHERDSQGVAVGHGILRSGHPQSKEFGGGLAARGATSLSKKERDKLDCQAIMRRLWQENPTMTNVAMCSHPDVQKYAFEYTGDHTLTNWAAEVDPRDDAQKPGPKRKR